MWGSSFINTHQYTIFPKFPNIGPNSPQWEFAGSPMAQSFKSTRYATRDTPEESVEGSLGSYEIKHLLRLSQPRDSIIIS